jgi:hypothetical protein
MLLKKPRRFVTTMALTLLSLADVGIHQCRATTPRVEPGSPSVFDVGDQWLTKTSVGGPVHIEPAVMMRKDVDSSKYAIEPVAAVHEELVDSVGYADQSLDNGEFVATSNDSGWRPLDTLTLFGGLEGSKQPQDFGVNANFGSRWAANWGFPLLAEYGIGGQIGTSINYTDNAVQVFERVGASTHRTQNFSTVGIFQRTDTWRWGIAYDALYESYYDQFFLGQVRGRVGYATSATNEFGVWFAVPTQSGNGNFQTIPIQLSTLTQGSVYWQHVFSAGTRTMVWAGAAEGHAQANLALGDLNKTGNQFVFGAEIDVPLNSYLSIYGQANFIGPADTGTVDSFLGLTYYPGGQAFPVTRSPFAPFQALVNSTMFAVDMRRN